jgi:hypothetical protein
MGMRLVLIASLLSVFGLLRAGEADAKCAAPSGAVAPHAGTAVPPDPVVYVFAPRWSAGESSVRVVAGEDELPFSLDVVSESDAFTTLRIAIETGGHDAFELMSKGSYGRTITSRFRVSDQWARPKRTAIRVRGAEYVVDSWMCSHTDAHFLAVTDAPAYRVQWATSRAAFARGAATTIVVPHHVDDFWLWGDERVKTGAGRIGLGHLNCFGETAATGRAYVRRFVRIKGLYPDGSESLSWSPIVEVGPGGLGKAEEPVAPSVAPPVQITVEPPPVEIAPVTPAVAPAPSSRAPRRYVAVAAPRDFDPSPLVALLAGVLGFLLGRRAVRRVSDATAARLAALADVSILQLLAVFMGAGACMLAVRAGLLAAADPCAALGFTIAAFTWALVAGAVAALARPRG